MMTSCLNNIVENNIRHIKGLMSRFVFFSLKYIEIST